MRLRSGQSTQGRRDEGEIQCTNLKLIGVSEQLCAQARPDFRDEADVGVLGTLGVALGENVKRNAAVAAAFSAAIDTHTSAASGHM
jgi:hypothetical protein